MINKPMKTRVITWVMTIMVCLLFSQTSQDVYATEVTSSGESRTEVTAHKDSAFTVILPKSISTNNANTLNYTVTVKGDVASGESITVAPIDASDSDDGVNVILKDASESIIKKHDVVATVVQDKDVWSSSEVMQKDDGSNLIGTTIAGNIASDVTAGNWDGALKFDITVESESILQPGLYTLDNVLVTPWEELISDGTVTVADGVLTMCSDKAILLTQKLVISEDVTEISDSAFYDCADLKQVIIPESVTTIGNGAFSGSGLTSINIPNSVTTMGVSVFAKCTSLVSANNVKVLPRYTFEDCTELSNLSIIDVTSIGDECFHNCTSLRSIDLPNTLVSIGVGSFDLCSNLESIDLPESIQTIGEGAFYGCTSIEDIRIPPSVISVGYQVFQGCTGLKTITVDNANSTYDSRDNCNAIINSSTNELVTGCKNTVIPDTVVTIGTYAFANHPDITAINIPTSVTTINQFAFQGDPILDVVIPPSVTSIQKGAFSNTEHMSYTGAKAPYSFGQAKSVSVTIPEGTTKIEVNAFISKGLVEVTIPPGVRLIEQKAFYNNSKLSNVDIPSTVTRIGTQAFQNVPHITYKGSAKGKPWGAKSIN